MTSSNFTTVALANNRVLVRGTDGFGKSGETVVDGTEWAAFKQRQETAQLHATFDAKVEEFFAPLIEAAEAVDQAHKVELDPLLFIVEQEGSTGREAQPEIVRQLSHDSVILRALESGAADRLVWVGDDTLEVTAQPVVAPVVNYDEVSGDTATSAE